MGNVIIFLFVSSVSLPGDDVLLLATFLSVSLYLCPCLFFFSDCVPRLVWFGSVYLVITARLFVADQLIT